MDTELDRTYSPFDDPANQGANREFENWLDETLRPTPESVEAEDAYWERWVGRMEGNFDDVHPER